MCSVPVGAKFLTPKKFQSRPNRELGNQYSRLQQKCLFTSAATLPAANKF